MQQTLEERFYSIKIANTLSTLNLFILPLLYVGGHSSYLSLRYFFFGSIALILGVTTIWTCLQARWIPKVFLKKWYNFGILIFLVAFTIVSLTSIDKVTSFFSTFQRTDGAFTIFFLVLFALNIFTLIAAHGNKIIYTLLRSSVLGAVAVSILILFSSDGVGTLFKDGRGGALIGNSSVAATYILFNIFFAVILFVKNRQKRIWWSITILLLLLSPLFFNWQLLIGKVPFTGISSLIGSARGALVGIIFGSIISVCAWLCFQTSKVKKYIGISALSLIIVATVFAGIQLLKPETQLHTNFAEVASETRYIFWDIAIKAFNERPLVGYGPGTFDIVYHDQFNPEMLLLPGGGEMWVDRTHNIFFETLVTGGIILLVALLALFASIVFGIIKAVRKQYLSSIEASLLIGAFAGWLLQAQFIFESILSLTMLFLMVGITYATSAINEDRGGYESIRLKQKLVIATTICLSIALFIFAIVLPYKKDRLMSKTYESNLPLRASMWQHLDGISPMGEGYDSVLMFNNVYKAYNARVEELRIAEPKLKQAVLDELDAISGYLFEKSETQPRSYGLNLIGAQMYYLRMRIAGEFSVASQRNAEILADRSIALSPTDPQAYWLAAQLKMVKKDFVSAKRLLEKAVSLEPRIRTSHQFVLQLAKYMNDEGYYKSSLARAQEAIPDDSFVK